jgi:hypothetical protein
MSEVVHDVGTLECRRREFESHPRRMPVFRCLAPAEALRPTKRTPPPPAPKEFSQVSTEAQAQKSNLNLNRPRDREPYVLMNYDASS